MVRIPLLFLVCALAITQVLGYCPNDCSGESQGVCTAADVCQCHEGYKGDDCSIYDKELRNHVAIEDTVPSRKWHYYHILANRQQASLEIEVNETGDSGDVDVYVRFDKYPTKSEYDQRDISTSRRAVFNIQSPHGLYYVGVYGFLGSSYSVMGTLKTACLNDCMGHGVCNFDGTCTCRAGHVGEDCSQRVDILTPNGVGVQGQVNKNGWKYYQFQNDENTIVLNLTQLIEHEDCDVYLKKGALPTRADYDFRDTSPAMESQLRVASASRGLYYVGVYGFTSSDYEISLVTYSECPNRCSGTTHGACNPSYTCDCQRAFTGDACETKVPAMVLDNRIESGFVDGNIWNYYHFDTFTSNNVVVTMRQVTADGDCDLYIKNGEAPTKFDFDYRNVSPLQVSTITIEHPASSTWHVGVYGYESCDYLLSALITQSCPNDCIDSEHGVCVKGHCECKGDWMSSDCSLKSVMLDNGVIHPGSIRSGDWQYFRFPAIAGAKVTFALKEKYGASVGNIWLYQSNSVPPTLHSFDHADTETNVGVHRIVVEVSEATVVNVGVYGSVLAAPNKDYEFDVVAWQSLL